MEGIDELKRQQGVSRQLQTIRGQILDRKGKILATNEPQFQLHINYKLTCLFDERVRRAKLLTAAKSSMLAKEKPSLHKVRKEMEAKLEELSKIIYKCTFFGQGQLDIEEQINFINNRIWNLRTFLAWRRNDPDPKIIAKYGRVSDVPFSDAIEDFEKKFPDADQRLLLIEKIQNIPEMNRPKRLLELKTDADVFDAQLEFMDIEGIEILPKESRSYPYGSVAAQTIGWVGLPQKKDMKLFANDKLARYLSEEVCGREDGVEYICETILRGRRGEELWDIDRQRVSRTETQFGKNVTMTLDIELQKKIEDHLADCNVNPKCQAPTAAVVIDVNTGDILALVSTPTFDLNRVRQDYKTLAFEDSNKPLLNRAINKSYPPGSVVKPLILIAGLQSGKITAGEPISCPAAKAPRGWPNCLIFSRHRIGHDYKWQNIARNAIRGSCNIYFSRLADRIDPSVLQLWLYKFGYAQKIPFAAEHRESTIQNRNLRQTAGTISSTVTKTPISRFEQIPPLYKGERRYFGIGQGNLYVTPLQVANAMAAIARGGVYKPPRLFLDSEPSSSENRESGTNLNISPQTIVVVHDGMSAVVNEPSGTAYTPFTQSTLIQQGVKVYGKTGSTQDPENAMFAGFATDNAGRSIAIAVLVEGGKSGSQDAAPLGFKIIQFCIDTENFGPPQSIIE
jgi:penicillin-binding protein 2